MSRDRRPQVAGPDSSDAILTEIRRSNLFLATLASRGMEQPKAIAFLDSAGLQPRQIAAALGINANTARVALHRMRKAEALNHEVTVPAASAADI